MPAGTSHRSRDRPSSSFAGRSPARGAKGIATNYQRRFAQCTLPPPGAEQPGDGWRKVGNGSRAWEVYRRAECVEVRSARGHRPNDMQIINRDREQIEQHHGARRQSSGVFFFREKVITGSTYPWIPQRGYQCGLPLLCRAYTPRGKPRSPLRSPP